MRTAALSGNANPFAEPSQSRFQRLRFSQDAVDFAQHRDRARFYAMRVRFVMERKATAPRKQPAGPEAGLTRRPPIQKNAIRHDCGFPALGPSQSTG